MARISGFRIVLFCLIAAGLLTFACAGVLVWRFVLPSLGPLLAVSGEVAKAYRTVSCQGPLRPRTPGRALISGTFNRRVAEALFGRRDPSRTVALFRQPVPLGRLFMTYLETAALNHPFREAEAVLIADPANLAF